jgi:hypothetical protein
VDLIPPGILDVLTRLVLINAIYFKGNWASQFDPRLTRAAPFWVTPREPMQVQMMAHFPAPAGAVRRLLPTQKLKPAQLVPGAAMLSIVAMEYRQITDMAPYNELGGMAPVLYEPGVNIPGLPLLFPDRFRRFGLYVHYLPVTTQAAYDFGVEIWGYPKFVAEIRFEEAGDVRRCQLRAEGKDILTLQVKKIATKAAPMNFYPAFGLNAGVTPLTY